MNWFFISLMLVANTFTKFLDQLIFQEKIGDPFWFLVEWYTSKSKRTWNYTQEWTHFSKTTEEKLTVGSLIGVNSYSEKLMRFKPNITNRLCFFIAQINCRILTSQISSEWIAGSFLIGRYLSKKDGNRNCHFGQGCT